MAQIANHQLVTKMRDMLGFEPAQPSLRRANDLTNYLGADFSFWRGFGSVIDLFGTATEVTWSWDPVLDDARALASDFAVLGLDFQEALEQLERETESIS